jgi:hypothetical protein
MADFEQEGSGEKASTPHQRFIAIDAGHQRFDHFLPSCDATRQDRLKTRSLLSGWMIRLTGAPSIGCRIRVSGSHAKPL